MILFCLSIGLKLIFEKCFPRMLLCSLGDAISPLWFRRLSWEWGGVVCDVCIFFDSAPELGAVSFVVYGVEVVFPAFGLFLCDEMRDSFV